MAILTTPCPIWLVPAEELAREDGVLTVNSPRAGGKYKISGSAGSMASALPSRDRSIITSWLVEQHQNGIEIPEIKPDALEELRRRRPLQFSEKIARVLRYYEAATSRIGESVSLDVSEPTTSKAANEVLALTECQDSNELMDLFVLLGETGFIKDDGAMGFIEFSPTPSGWLRIDEMRKSATDAQQAFVAMWFDKSTEAAYREGIEPAIVDSGHKALRIDRKEHVNKIDDEIIAEIRRSRFLVADFTCESQKVRGGVYYEAGFAAALGIPVIWTCKQSSINDLHFDTRQYNHITCNEPTDLYARLKARIGAVIGDGPLKSA